MIEVVSGHLGSGTWRLADIDGITVFSHRQPFNVDGQFRIGPDQVESYDIETQTDTMTTLTIRFTGERHCLATMPTSELAQLDKMVSSQQAAPVFVKDNRRWIQGLILFFIACAVYEFIK